ncbi:arylsulfotransferase family protein [Lutibacter sp. TH_r2]|uniref:arylsulfotransferase family protein n=1 Tax=Lutibacter sp. TH_r2 TaxID=3082083 RepID=UPI002955587D|nr:arylsulfotransferase family protein [Lutibacter sp. TH_r2]MDV7187370.1 arylsulfotransferase family protein [Lutibacter sp. TH_r2]
MKNNIKLTILLIIGLNLCQFLIAQNTTLGLRLYNEGVSDGYVLFTPGGNNSVYLVNNCGYLVNSWEFDETPGSTCYFLENGNLLRAGKKSIEIRDWDNNIIWSYDMSTIGNQHHDIEPLPNGNILCLVKDLYTSSAMAEYGRNPKNLDDNDFKLEKIVEIEPLGSNDANIVWEWKFIDHIIQDYDKTKFNYGNVSENSQLIDINYYDDELSISDFIHGNAIDYNKELDQILISARNLNEIYIIDHSTTTSEAKGSTGGTYNRGGDILWRWGNPKVYQQGDTKDQKLFLQHDAKWVEEGYLDEGKISVFNNGGNGTEIFSSIHLIVPEIDNNSYKKEKSIFLPNEFNWSWSGSVFGEVVYQSNKSGAQSLPNGNFIFCETSKGQITEINKNGDILWVYKNPSGSRIYNQAEDPISNAIFRAERYPIDYDGFSSIEKRKLSIIEDENSLSSSCESNLSVELIEASEFNVKNPVENGILKFTKYVTLEEITVYSFSGNKVFFQKSFTGESLNVPVQPGIYILTFKQNAQQYQKKILII